MAKFPMSYYDERVYSLLTANYLSAGDTDKMIDAGNKALALDPDDIDVLPIWLGPFRDASTGPRGQTESCCRRRKPMRIMGLI